jgi:site-specific DNA-cytosine methylase
LLFQNLYLITNQKGLKNMRFRFGELFSGPGGLGLAAQLAKVEFKGTTYEINHAWATDYDKDSCKTYSSNICPNNPETIVCKDIRKLCGILKKEPTHKQHIWFLPPRNPDREKTKRAVF